MVQITKQREIKGEIKEIKSLIKFGIAQEQIKENAHLKFLTHETLKDHLDENLTYIGDHMSDTDSQIAEELGLIGSITSDDFA